MPKKIKTEMHGDTSRHGPRADAKKTANKARRAIDVVDVAIGDTDEEPGFAACSRCVDGYAACGGLCAECIESPDRLFGRDYVDLTEAELREWEETGDLPASVLERFERDKKMSATIADVVRRHSDLLEALREGGD